MDKAKVQELANDLMFSVNDDEINDIIKEFESLDKMISFFDSINTDKVEEIFTHSYEGFTASQRAAIQDWANTGNYKKYRKFVVDYGADVDNYFEDFLDEVDPYMELEEERVYNKLKQLKYNTNILEDVCNNQTKKSKQINTGNIFYNGESIK